MQEDTYLDTQSTFTTFSSSHLSRENRIQGVNTDQNSNNKIQQNSHPPKNNNNKKMKVLTLNFLTCAVKACKSSNDSFPLHPKDAELVQDEIEINPDLLVNVLPRIDWTALRTTSTEVSKTLKLFFSPSPFPSCLNFTHSFFTYSVFSNVFCWPFFSFNDSACKKEEKG